MEGFDRRLEEMGLDPMMYGYTLDELATATIDRARPQTSNRTPARAKASGQDGIPAER